MKTLIISLIVSQSAWANVDPAKDPAGTGSGTAAIAVDCIPCHSMMNTVPPASQASPQEDLQTAEAVLPQVGKPDAPTGQSSGAKQ